MKHFLLITLFSLMSHAESGNILQLTQNVFLKIGFSSILEFQEEPQKIVLGDSQSFQVEKLNKSLVVRSLVPYASSNLFVYFKNQDTQIFSLTASEDANPTLLKKIEPLNLRQILKESTKPNNTEDNNKKSENIDIKSHVLKKPLREKISITKSTFSRAKDYLTLDLRISAGSQAALLPKWDLTRLGCNNSKMSAYKIWAERKEIQKDSEIKARITFLRPNIDIQLKRCTLIVPLSGRLDALKIGVR